MVTDTLVPRLLIAMSIHSSSVAMELSCEAMKKGANVALFTSMGMGHLIPFAELARRLATHYECSVTFITLKFHPTSRQNAVLRTLKDIPDSVRIVEISGVDYEGIALDETKLPETKVSMIAEKTKPALEAALRHLPEPPQALIIDFFCTPLIDAAKKLGVPTYLFFVSGASVLAVLYAVTEMTESVSLKDCDHLLHVEGLPPLQTKDLPEPLQVRDTENFSWFIYHISRLPEMHGILVNTFTDLETQILGALNLPKKPPLPPVHAVGPVIMTAPESQTACLQWLDTQPPGSVVYVAFGSGVTFSKDQVAEIAFGLRDSSQRFLWVIRRPISDADAARTYVSVSRTDVTGFLPDGFVEMTKEVGMVVPYWVPQTLILGHRAVGAFLSHGGWNSTLESIWSGVPMIVCLVFAEQRLNRVVIVDVLGAGVGVQMDEDTGFVERKEVERCVREMMEGGKGKKVREKATQFSNKGRLANAQGGSLHIAIAGIVEKWSS